MEISLFPIVKQEWKTFYPGLSANRKYGDNTLIKL